MPKILARSSSVSRGTPPEVQRQRRLSAATAKELVAEYEQGATVEQLVRRYAIHRTTVLAHLERSGVDRRPNTAAIIGARLDRAIDLYESGLSLAAVGEHMAVDGKTVARVLQQAGVPIRPRQGWSSAKPQ